MSASEKENQGPVIRDRRRIDPVTGQPRRPDRSGEQSQAGDTQAGQAPRGPGQPRPGKHAASKPGTSRQDGAASSAQASAGQAASDQATQAGDSGPASANTASANTGPASTGPASTAPANTGPAQTDQSSPPDGADGGSQRNGGPDLAAMLAERTADLQRLQAEYANYRKRVERDRAAVREYALANVVSELLPVLDDIGRAREHEELTGGFKAVAESLESAASKLGLTTFGEAGEAFDPNVHEALMHSYSPDVTEPTCVQILQPGYKVGERILRPARVAVAEPSDPVGARTASAPDETSTSEPSETDRNADGENSPARDEAD